MEQRGQPFPLPSGSVGPDATQGRLALWAARAHCWLSQLAATQNTQISFNRAALQPLVERVNGDFPLILPLWWQRCRLSQWHQAHVPHLSQRLAGLACLTVWALAPHDPLLTTHVSCDWGSLFEWCVSKYRTPEPEFGHRSCQQNGLLCSYKLRLCRST